MRRILQGMMLAICCVGCATGGQVSTVKWKPNERLIQAQADYDAALNLAEMGGYSEALVRAEHALSMKEAVLGETNDGLAQNLNLVGWLHRQNGNWVRAESLLQRALAMREALIHKSHPETEATSLNRIAILLVAQSLNNLADLYSAQQLYDRAESHLQRALVMTKATFGERHPVVAMLLNSLADLYFKQKSYDRAETLYQRSLAIRERVFGELHPTVAIALGNLANLYFKQKSYDRAEPLYRRSIAIRDALLEQSQPSIKTVLHKKRTILDIAFSLKELAGLYTAQGLYEQAKPFYERTLALREIALGKDHHDVIQSLHDLANIYCRQGLYDRAEPLFRRALAHQEARLGKNHLLVGYTLKGLASIYNAQGLYDQAEPLYERALVIQETALGKTHLLVGSTLVNLANVYTNKELYDQAEPLYERALVIKKAALGPDHPDVAYSLINLAQLYFKQGMYDKAEPLHQRALVIREAALGPNHPDVAYSLKSLAYLYLSQGLNDKAEPLLQRALRIGESFLGKNHPFVADSLNQLALVRSAQHRLDDAIPLLIRSFSISEQRLRHEALEFSESRLSGFLHYLREDEEMHCALLRAHPRDARLQHLLLSTTLLLKGRSVAETAHISRTFYQRLGPEDRIALEQLTTLRAQLASFSFSSSNSLLQGSQTSYQRLVEEADALEALLAQRSASLRSLSSLPSPSDIVERVAASLPKDGVLIEFIAYRDMPLVRPPGVSWATSRALRYFALVLFPDGSIRTADLGLAAPIDVAASHLRDALARKDASFQDTAQRLYNLVFQPLRPLLGRTRRLLVSPDGQLGLVPFAALHDGRDFLLDSYDFTYLVSGTQLLPRPEVPPASSVVVLADPDFSATPSVHPSSSVSLLTDSSRTLTHFFSRSDWPSAAWRRLPGTRQEANDIQRLLPQAQLFLDTEATKQRLLRLATPGILHVATHGFFFNDNPSLPSSRGLGVDNELSRNLFQPQHEPLLNSGIVLSGATAQGVSVPQLNDSLVTALELIGLNLWGTQLVVLSACDTGLGEVSIGEGVLGLRRALMVAGAETVVMSLWKVDDDSTRLLMDAYYRGLLAGQGRASALREAMRSLRASRPHPYHWAPFIALGSDAPLHGIAPGTPQPAEPPRAATP